MNHTYRLVWSEATQSYVPAAEGTRARKKSGGRKRLVVIALAALGAVSSAFAGPSGGEVVAGQASITQDGTTTTISQQSQNAALNWQQFDIAANETVQFVQPSASSIALNRVIGNEASEIYGQLRSNGQVFLINPNGVLFGRTAQVDVGGLVASTLNISDEDFRAGNYRFTGDTPAGIVNEGTIAAAEGGSVALLGGQVRNQGTISARLGTVALAAGSAISLDFSGQQLMNVKVDADTFNALVQNHHLIQADGGNVIMTAAARDALLGTVVNNTGVIQARTVEERDGQILLLGGFDGGTVNVAGTLDASAPDGGDGGYIDTSGAYVKVADDARITTLAPQGSAGTWLIDPPDFTIAASGGDISGATLSANLQNGNVSILSSQGTVNVAGNGDIHVNDAITWDSGTTLTLTAVRHVNVNQAITNTGSPANGGVTLRADSAGACVAGASNCGTINFAGAGHVTAATTNLYYNPAGSNAAADANGMGPSYATPTNYSANVTGTLNAFMLVNDVNQLQAINTNRGGTYALGRNIDASVTRSWNSGAGFVPIGPRATPFTGRFDGQGHTISGLFINRAQSNLGLFGKTNNATIRHVGLIGADITQSGQYEFVGALAGETVGGILDDVYATSVSVTGVVRVGGLVGTNGSALSNAYATGAVSGSVNRVGGLVGENFSLLSGVHAAVTVTGSDYVGGLVGYGAGQGITGAYATGTVTGRDYVGGLAGYSGSSQGIRGAYATGTVTGRNTVGGLVGLNIGDIAGSYASGAVSGTGNVGGLAGSNYRTVSSSYASGSVTGTSQVGGLVGNNFKSVPTAPTPTISSSYATGSVAGSSRVGGLVGLNSGQIESTYATGRVTGSTSVGGLNGGNNGSGSVTASFWDTDTSGQSSSAGGTGKTSHELKQLSTFSNWSISGSGGSSAVWRIYEGYTAPLLRSFMTDLTISVDNVSTTYNGAAQSTSIAYNAGNADRSLIFTDNTSYRNAGSYNLGSRVYSNQQGYDISYSGGTMNIERANVSLSSSDVVKTYDGTTAASGTATVVGGTSLLGSDSLSGGTFAFTDKNAGAGKTVTVGGVTINDGNGGNNYNVSYIDNTTSTINPATLTYTVTATDKVYDGTTAAVVTLSGLTGLVGNETLGVSGTGTFDSKDVATARTVRVNSVGLADGTNGGLASNYSIATGGTAAANITARSLTYTTTAADKVYDGTTAAAVTLSGLNGLVGNETLAVSGTGSFNSKDVVTANTVTIDSVNLADGTNGGLASNYSIASGGTARANITARSLTYTTTAADKVYDGTTAATVTLSGLTGLIGNETLGVSGTGTFNSKDVTAANTVTVNTATLTNGSNGGLATNYSIAAGGTAAANITARSLTYTTAAADKVYDGTTAATVTLGGLTGLVGNETLDASGTGTFNSKDVVTANSVRVDSVSLANGTNGGLASNYTLGAVDTVAANIRARSLTYTASAADKVYDGTTAATVTLNRLTGLVGNETLGVNGTGTFNSKDVATANTVTINSVNVTDGSNGGLASNYSIAAGGTAAANITAKSLTYTTTARDKVYDGTAAASVTLSGLTGLVGNETLGVSGTGTFNSKDVATAHTVTVNSANLTNGSNGGLASNYRIAPGGTAAARIKPAALTIAANDQTRPINTPNPSFTASYTGFVAGESAATLTKQPTLSTTADTTSAAGSYAIDVSDAVDPNYTFSYVPGTLIVTNPVPLLDYLGVLSYADDVGSADRNEQEEAGMDERFARNNLLLKNLGMRLPAGVKQEFVTR